MDLNWVGLIICDFFFTKYVQYYHTTQYSVDWICGFGTTYLEKNGERQGSLVCCSPWGHKESDTTEQLNGTELNCLSIVQLLMLAVWGERGYGDGSTLYVWLSSISLLPWLLGFPPQASLITISSLISTRSVSMQSTAALALRLMHNP